MEGMSMSSLGAAYYRLARNVRQVLYHYRLPGSRQLVTSFWETQALIIHAAWGDDHYDYAVLTQILLERAAKSVLDIGCGSGRLFALYAQLGVIDVVGVDISATSLALARERHRDVTLLRTRVEDLDLPQGRFDIAISNRVLCCVPPHAISTAIDRIARCSATVYINERIDPQSASEEYYLYNHDYNELFGEIGLRLLREGTVGDQHYQLFGRLDF